MAGQHRSFVRRGASVAAALAALLLTAAVVRAQQSPELLFEWQGRVDRELQIDVSGNRITPRGVYEREERGRVQRVNSIPRGNGQLIVQRVIERE